MFRPCRPSNFFFELPLRQRSQFWHPYTLSNSSPSSTPMSFSVATCAVSLRRSNYWSRSVSKDSERLKTKIFFTSLAVAEPWRWTLLDRPPHLYSRVLLLALKWWPTVTMSEAGKLGFTLFIMCISIATNPLTPSMRSPNPLKNTTPSGFFFLFLPPGRLFKQKHTKKETPPGSFLVSSFLWSNYNERQHWSRAGSP